MDYSPKLSHVVFLLLLGSGLFILAMYWAPAAAVLRITGALAWLIGYCVLHMLIALNRPPQPAQAPERKPAPVETRIRLTDERQGGWEESLYNLPASPEQLADLAEGLEQGQPFSERTWTGAGRPFSLNQFRALRDALIQRNLLTLASEKDPRQGYAFTVAGQHVLHSFLPSPTPPVRMLQLREG